MLTRATRSDVVTESQRASHGGDLPRAPFVRVASRRGQGDAGRLAPRLRLDVLQVVAWGGGLCLVVIGLVALARAGFDQISLGEPMVRVTGLATTPLLALLMLALGVTLLAAATGEVHDRTLRMLGVAIGVVGAVWTIEPDAFLGLLGVERTNGVAALALAAAIVLTSFVPPLSIRRPGVDDPGGTH